jgi:putative ABC transport system ATP-binding protein
MVSQIVVDMFNQSASQSLVELRDVVKVYATAAGEFTALRGIDLQVEAGEFVGIVGKSGAGKSTLLNMITGVDKLTSGEVLVHSNGSPLSIHALSEDEIALWRGRNVGVVYQSFQLLPMLTLVENITLPMDLCGLFKPKESRERALELLRLVEIEEHANKLPAFISGGQQQRVAIARALANDPPILVADEPTGSLDSITADHIFDVFEHLVSDQGKTIIMVTHDNSLAPRFSRHLAIADGEIAHRKNRPERSQAQSKGVVGAALQKMDRASAPRKRDGALQRDGRRGRTK